MNRKKHIIATGDTLNIEEENTFLEIQTLWDEQSVRIDDVVDKEERYICPSEKRAQMGTPYRVRMIALNTVLTTIALVATVYWGMEMPSLVFSVISLCVSIAAELVFLVLLGSCLYWTVSLLVYEPSRVGIMRMSRFIGRYNIPSRHDSEEKGKSEADRSTVMRKAGNSNIMFVNDWGQSQSRSKRVAACITVVVALACTSCTTTGIDGNTITQNHSNRAATIETVAQIIEMI